MVGERADWEARPVRSRVSPIVLVLAASFLGALPSTGAAAWSAGEQLTGIVTPTVGVAVGADGSFAQSTGTQPSSVTRVPNGSGVTVTIVPAF